MIQQGRVFGFCGMLFSLAHLCWEGCAVGAEPDQAVEAETEAEREERLFGMLQGERLAERKKKQLESYLRGDGVTLFYHMTHTGGTTLVRKIINHADNLPDIVHTASTYNLGNIKLVPLKKARASNFIDYLNLTRKADGAHVNHMNFEGLMPKDGGFPWESEDIFSFTTLLSLLGIKTGSQPVNHKGGSFRPVPVTTHHLEEAKRRLRQFNLIICADYFKESAQLLCKVLKWKHCAPPPYTKGGRPNRDLIHNDSKIVDFFIANQPEFELWNFARDLCAQQLQANGLPLPNETYGLSVSHDKVRSVDPNAKDDGHLSAKQYVGEESYALLHHDFEGL